MAAHKPVLHVIAGPNGSGKTTFTGLLLKDTWTAGCLYINPDEIAQHEFGDWNSQDASFRAAVKAEAIRTKCLETKQSMVVETVLSKEDKIDFIRLAKEQGFFVRLFFIGTDDPLINVKRVFKRYEAGGHKVDPEKIISRYYRSLALFCYAARIADKAYLYDNSVDEHEPRILFRTVNGRVHKQYACLAQHEWGQVLLDDLGETF